MKQHNETHTPGSGQSDVFNEAEAAAYLHQKPRTIRDWRATRGLPCFMVAVGVVAVMAVATTELTLQATRLTD